MKLLRFLLLPALALALSACAMIPDGPVTADAKQAVRVALTTYTQVYQPVLIAYGKLPVCPNPTPSGTICHDRAVFAQLAAADAVVNVSADTARKVLTDNYTDPGALQRVVEAIQNAQVKIASAGLLTNKGQ